MSLDLGHLPDKGDVQVFRACGGAAAAYVWQVWKKPRGVKMVHFFGVGGGGGGGAGAVGAASTAGGGAGGSSGAMLSASIPAFLLPDVLYVFVAPGGAASTAAAISWISQCNTSAAGPSVPNYLFRISGGAAGGAGGAGTAGTAGGAASVQVYSHVGVLASGSGTQPSTFQGINGTNGGSTGVAANLSLANGHIVTGGTGGGGLGAAGVAGKQGGDITGAAPMFPTLSGGAGGATTPTAGSRGNDGFQINGTFFFYGGTGGGSSGLSAGAGDNGGNGGNGATGCGGGGGGAAFTAKTAGVGGRGGDGLIIVTAW